MVTVSGTAPISWEYLMPKRKERMAGYIRESDPTLATSTTIESAAKAIADYGKEAGYIYEREKYEYREAISAYEVPWQKRNKSLQKIVIRLNDMGIPSPKGSIWSLSTVARILQNPILYGEVYTNRYRQVKNTLTENGKQSVIMKLRPQEEWIRLPDAPSVISKETFDAVQEHMRQNRRESLRNNQHPEELGLLRAGYITCGICQSNMFVLYPSAKERRERPWKKPRYVCQQRDGGTDPVHNHRTQIYLPNIEEAVRETIVQSI